MAGSRLLFSGYGDRAYSRSLHAGLLGNDTVVIFDECHLVPGFGNVLRLVKEAGGKLRPFHYMLMSTTSAEGEVQTSDSDLKSGILGKRLRAHSMLHSDCLPALAVEHIYPNLTRSRRIHCQ
jgi:CRISPR-associated endonuclease/helicase Cas3